jgi:CRP-like cAMP-binding protein
MSNILAKRLPEIKDLPLQYKVVLAGPGTLLGEEDAILKSQYRCTVRCYSAKGSLYEMPVENFMNLKN